MTSDHIVHRPMCYTRNLQFFHPHVLHMESDSQLYCLVSHELHKYKITDDEQIPSKITVTKRINNQMTSFQDCSFIVKGLSAKRHAAASTGRDSPVSPALVVKEPATVISVKPLTSSSNDVEQSDMDTASSSSTTLNATATADSHCLPGEDEADSSSRSEPPNTDNSIQSTSQYFVSSSGNQPLQELPKLHKAAR